MYFRPRLIFMLIAVALTLGFPIQAAAQVPAAPAGVIAFVGINSQGDANVYVLNLGTGQIGQIVIPVTPDADLAWHPDGDILAFTTTDGGYGLLRSLRGCFEGSNICADTIELLPPFYARQLVWLPGGDDMLFLTDDGIKQAPLRARQGQISDLSITCAAGIAAAYDPFSILCADQDAGGNTSASVYQPGEQNFTDFIKLYTIGTYPTITAFAIGQDGQAAAGTLEAAGDSGFYASVDSAPQRLASYQIHVYDMAFSSTGDQLAVAGAISDSTGDGTLRDGDAAELHLYDSLTGQLNAIAGFTGLTNVTWSPDGLHLLTVLKNNQFQIYTPQSNQTTPVNVQLPANMEIFNPEWNPAEITPPTVVATATPVPTPTVFATVAPLPTFTPWPTLTPIPTVTPGSPMGTGCEYAYAAGAPVTTGDTAEVTQRGAAVRFRTGPALTADMIDELAVGTRMTVLEGPYCAQGYRWWQVQVESTGRIGYLADSDTGGYWIQKAAATPPPLPSESISFYADRYAIPEGECVTIRWDVEGIKAVYYEGIGVTGHDTRLECPTSSYTYQLRVVRQDDSETTQTVTIIVNPGY